MEDLIIPLVIIVIGLLNFSKARKKKLLAKNPPAESSQNEAAAEPVPIKKEGLFSRINKVLEEYSEMKPESDEDDWPPKEEEVPIEVRSEIPETADPMEVSDKKPSDSTKPLMPVTPLVSASTVLDPVSKDKKSNSEFDRTITPKKLRNAVIWSEILSPPVSLRED